MITAKKSRVKRINGRDLRKGCYFMKFQNLVEKMRSEPNGNLGNFSSEGR